jgi:hypothetical protein
MSIGDLNSSPGSAGETEIERQTKIEIAGGDRTRRMRGRAESRNPRGTEWSRVFDLTEDLEWL